jgi:hypothetical protein
LLKHLQGFGRIQNCPAGLAVRSSPNTCRGVY